MIINNISQSIPLHPAMANYFNAVASNEEPWQFNPSTLTGFKGFKLERHYSGRQIDLLQTCLLCFTNLVSLAASSVGHIDTLPLGLSTDFMVEHLN